MPERPTDGGSFPEDRYKNPETALGGADAVEKTTYVTGQGHRARARASRPTRCAGRAGHPRRGRAGAPTWAIIAFLAIAGGASCTCSGVGR